jgi:plasmid stabilization system protein ParE
VDYEVVLTQAALNDLDEIVEYIGRDDMRAARRIALDLLRRAESLSKMPRRGKSIRARSGVRRLVRNPYLIIYRIAEAERTVSVLRFWHGARDPNSLPLDE